MSCRESLSLSFFFYEMDIALQVVEETRKMAPAGGRRPCSVMGGSAGFVIGMDLEGQ